MNSPFLFPIFSLTLQRRSQTFYVNFHIVSFVVITLYSPTRVYGQHLFGQAFFDCRRIHSRYCCSSRVRFSCPQMCLQHPCNTPPSIQSYMPHSSLYESSSFALGRNRNNIPTQQTIRQPTEAVPAAIPQQPFGIILPPPDTGLARESSGTNSSLLTFGNSEGNKQDPKINFLPDLDSLPSTTHIHGKNAWKTSGSTPFPTLIPWNANTVLPTSSSAQNAGGAMDGEVRADGQSRQTGPENGRVKLSGALMPPPSLSSDYDGLELLSGEMIETKDNERALSATVEYSTSEPLTQTDKPAVQNVPPLPTHPETTWIPLRFNIKPSALNSSRASRTTLTDSGTFMTATAPSTTLVETKNSAGHSGNESEKSIYSDEDASESGKIENGTERVPMHKIKPLSFSSSFKRRGDLPMPVEENAYSGLSSNGIGALDKSWNKETKPPSPSQNANASADETGVGLFGNKINIIIDHLITQKTIDAISALTGRKPKTRNNHRKHNAMTTTISYTVPSSTATIGHNANLQCGSAPDYRPCVEMQIANEILLGCCRQKLMPAGCLELCRYNISQAEIKKAFDAGKCGILNVAPYLECASQGENNVGCCRQQKIAQKSGQQCEVFCNPGKGLGALGLQHLACQNVIGDLLKCHHSGLRQKGV